MTVPTHQPCKPAILSDPDEARAVGRRALIYLNLTNYRNSWKRLGFADDDVTKPAVTASSTPSSRMAPSTRSPRDSGSGEHRDAGADHVTVQVLTGPDKLVDAPAQLAGPLGLK